MKVKTVFNCQKCGYQSPKWLGRCPDCQAWNSFAEEDYAPVEPRERSRVSFNTEGPVLLKDVEVKDAMRFKTGISELDRVLGGGLVHGSVVLIGGDPGVGKSTISLQVSNQLSMQGINVLYVSAEESTQQTKLRAKRLGAKDSESLYIVNQTDLGLIVEYIKKLKPQVVVVDSIQVIFDSQFSPSAGSVTQVRECASALTQIAKATGISIFIIGHVTKEGALAGPRVLEHIVDTVLYFEGTDLRYTDSARSQEQVRSTNEIGVFKWDEGLEEVSNPLRYSFRKAARRIGFGSHICAGRFPSAFS